MEITQSQPATDTKKRSFNRYVRWAMLALAILLIAGIGYELARIGVHARSAYVHGTALLNLAENGVRPEMIGQAQPLVRDISVDMANLERDIRPLTPLLRRLDGVTQYGSTIAYSPELLSAGAALLGVAADGLEILGPALADPGDTPIHIAALSALSGQEARFTAMAEQAENAVRILGKLPVDRLHPRIAGRLSQVQPLLPLMAPGLRMAPALPKILGVERPYRFLLLIQNNQEIRATGGFITGVGRMTLDQAAPTELLFSDSYKVDNHKVDHPPAPEPMQRFMNIPTMFLRDVNWSPDFPTTAQLARSMYARDQGITVDGVVSIDLRAVQLLIDGLGPLTVDGIDEPVTGDNVVTLIKELWTNPINDPGLSENQGKWWTNRKDFMPLMAAAVLEKVRTGKVDYVALLQAGIQALDERAVQVWVEEPVLQDQLAELGWDGGLHPEPGADFLSLIDSNIGFNKVDAILRRSVFYEVAWPDGPGQPAVAQVHITYEHPLQIPNHSCLLSPRYGDTYDEMTRRCYYDFVRVYVPKDSKLLDTRGVWKSSLADKREGSEVRYFGGFFVLETGSKHTVTFSYQLPDYIQPDTYRLVLQRQSGSTPLPFSWRVGDQEGQTLVESGRFEWRAE
jgi:hypothetical protein